MLRAALRTKHFSALLTFLLSFSREFRRLRLGTAIAHDSHPGLNTDDTVTPMNLDDDAFLLDSFHNLVFPADAVALLFARELHRLAIAQESDHRFPIDIDIFVLSR
ncbi:MAG: hypothetical protein KY456_12010 [Chloroflexi bacterium]|nr:hypothetical protein [Chloroflexota bacterium]